MAASRSEWSPGQRLEREIYDSGMTKEAVANRAGIGRNTIFQMCNDRPALLSSWQKVASALGMDAAELVRRCVG